MDYYWSYNICTPTRHNKWGFNELLYGVYKLFFVSINEII